MIQIVFSLLFSLINIYQLKNKGVKKKVEKFKL